MEVDQSGAIAMWVPQSITFDYTDATWVVLHKTAGFSTAQDCAAYFADLSKNTAQVSAHYIVGQDGTIVQCVPESRGAGGNCCLEAGHASYLPTDINLNLKTISIEHIDPATDNSTPLTSLQQKASTQLVHDICVRHNIPMRDGDAEGGIIGHDDIDPISRARCPGNYPRTELYASLAAMQSAKISSTTTNLPLWLQYTTGGHKAMAMSAAMTADATKEFNALSSQFGTKSFTTGIAAAWKDMYSRGLRMGPALTGEEISNDWSNNKLIVQHFLYARAEYNPKNGQTKWYSAYGEIVVS